MDPRINASSIWQGLDLRDRRSLLNLIAAPIIGLAAARLLYSLISSRPNAQNTVLASPRKSLQLLSKQDPDSLPYPPDALPGARDIDTPYGNVRAYEWGPEDGRKVLFVHGISTPCVAFAGMAKLLAENGCRVMLFDLFGRGYSDAPDPKMYRQDMKLWTSQILLVLTSSKLAWTGSDRFTMIGYSMGGGISASFTSYFPELVESLVLVAPGGLIRSHRISRVNKFLCGNLLPEFLVYRIVGQRLMGSPLPPGVKHTKPTEQSTTGPVEAAQAEVPSHPAHEKDLEAALFSDKPAISPAKVVSWQVGVHPGFVPSFISSIKYAPVTGELETARWEMIGRRCSARRVAPPEKAARMPGLKEGKVLILLGEQDPIIVANEIEEDAIAALGAENVEVVRLQGAHDLPVVNSHGCADAIFQFWEG